jgi:O-antigen/teichoic acid export membrane protein/glycosyltransferase involved in cell wall biosynthesis
MRFFKGKLIRNTGWVFLGQGLGLGLRAAYFVIIARLLGVQQYGVVVGAFALVNLVAEHSRLGTGTVLLRYVSAEHKRFAAYWGSTLIVTSFMSVALIVILRQLAPHLLDAKSAAIVGLTAAGSCLFEQITISSTQAFQAFQQMRTGAILNQLTSLLRTIAAVGMILIMHTATAAQWATVSMIASAVGTVIALIVTTAYLGWPKFAPLLALRHSGEGVEYSLSASATSAYNDLDKTMLSHYGMSSENGIYGMAYRIIEMGFTPSASIQLAASPRLFQLAGTSLWEPIVLGRRLLKHSVSVSALSALCMFVFAPVIPLLVGKGFSEGVLALRWLCLIPVFRSVHGITGSVLTAIGKQRYRTATQITAVALNFGLNLWLIPANGWQGAAWSSLATDGSLGVLNWVGLKWMSRKLKPEAQPVVARENTNQIAEVSTAQPLVSIVIPYFNHPAYLAETIASARQQSYSNIEIIVVDDGSAIPADTILAPSSDIELVRTENHGVSVARNIGFEKCSGEYIIFLDSDDRLMPDAVSSHLKLLKGNPSAGMTFGAASIIDEKGNETSPASICRPRKDYFAMLLQSNPIACPGSTMIRREAFLDAGQFDPSFRNAEDYHLYLRIARRSPVVQHNDCVVEYRKHSGGKSQNKERMILAVTAILDQIESTGNLSPVELKKLRHGRSRWLHVFRPKSSLSYRIRSLYYSFHAMLSVPLSHYFKSSQ